MTTAASAPETTVLHVGGLNYASENTVVEQVLGRRPGVLSVDANPVAQTATLVFDPGATRVEQLRTWVRECGYHCAGQSVPGHVCDPLVAPDHGPHDRAAAQRAAEAHGHGHGGHAGMSTAEGDSEHPLAAAIVRAARERRLKVPRADAFEAVPGHGALATVAGRRLAIGNARLMQREGVSFDGLAARAQELAGEGRTVVQVAIDGRAGGLIAIADAPRDTAAEAVRALHHLGVRTVMLSGDSRPTAERIAREVGIAIGTGTDVAVETADVVLMRSDPLDVATAITISRGTLRKMHQNLAWAVGYNALAIAVAAGVLEPIGFVLRPEVGAISMSGSSVIVAVNALALKRLRLPRRPASQP